MTDGQLDALESSVCKTGEPTVGNALQCGCHSAQSDFKSGMVGPCELTEFNGKLYITGNLTNSIIEFDMESEQATHFPIPQKDSVPVGIDNTEDKIWFTQMLTASLSTFDPSSGDFEQFSIRHKGAFRTGSTTVAVDNDDIPWFTASTGGFAGKILGQDNVKTQSLPGNLPGPRGMDVSRGDAIVASQRHEALFRISEDADSIEKVVDFPTTSQPVGVLIDQEGSLFDTDIAYVTLSVGDALAIVDLDNETIIDKVQFADNSRPSRLTFGPEGQVWVTKLIANEISRVNPLSLEVDTWKVPFPSSAPEGIEEVDGDMWFNMWAADRIGKFDPDKEEFETWILPGTTRLTDNTNAVNEVAHMMRENRSQVQAMLRRPSELPLSSVNLKDRLDPSNILEVYDAILDGFETYVETGDDEAATMALMSGLPDRDPPPQGNKVILGPAAWTSLMGALVSMGLIQKVKQFIRLLIILIKDWLRHRLDP